MLADTGKLDTNTLHREEGELLSMFSDKLGLEAGEFLHASDRNVGTLPHR